MTTAWVELIAAAVSGSVSTGLLIVFSLRKKIAVAIDKAPDKLSDALAEHLNSEDGQEFFSGEGAIQWIQSEIEANTKQGRIHLHATGREAESVEPAELIPRLSHLIVDWALSEALEARVVSWCHGLHRNHADKRLADIIPTPIISALDAAVKWLSLAPQKNSRWIAIFIQNLRTQERLIGEFISERTLDEIMDTIESRLRFIGNNTDILDHPVILEAFLPWWAEYSKEKISFWESAGVGLFNTFKLGLPVNPADGRAVLKWWSDSENQQQTKETVQKRINDLLASDNRLLLREKIQSQRERRVCDFIAEIPEAVYDSFESALMTEVASPEWEHWIFSSSEKLLHFALNRPISAYLNDLDGWRPEATMAVDEALSENVQRVFSWCRSEQMGPEIKRWLTHYFQDWLEELRFESGLSGPILEKSLEKAHSGLEKELGSGGRLRKAINSSLKSTQHHLRQWNKTLGGGTMKIQLVAVAIGTLSAVIVGLLGQVF